MNSNYSQHPAERSANPWTVATAGLTLAWALALPVVAAIAAPADQPSVSPTAASAMEQQLSAKNSKPRWCRFIPRPYRIYVPDCQ